VPGRREAGLGCPRAGSLLRRYRRQGRPPSAPRQWRRPELSRRQDHWLDGAAGAGWRDRCPLERHPLTELRNRPRRAAMARRSIRTDSCGWRFARGRRSWRCVRTADSSGSSTCPSSCLPASCSAGPTSNELYVTTIDPALVGRQSEPGGELFVIEGLGARGLPEPRHAG
jgi:hypothetical protein